MWEKTAYDLEELEIIKIQDYRSDQRKSRNQKLPILLSILKEINNSSNLFDLAIRYDKYKSKLQTSSQKEEQYNEIMCSISFSQTKSNINPYQDAQRKQTQIVTDQKNGQFKNIINLLEATELNIKSDLNNIQQENKHLKKKISTYFDSLWTSTSNRNPQVNELNYGLKDRQEHYQEIQLSTLPILEKERSQLVCYKENQEKQIQNQTRDLENFNSTQEKYQDQSNYISELKKGYELLEDQVASIKERVEKLKQAQEVMHLETKIEQFCSQILVRQNEGRKQILESLNDFLEKAKFQLMRKYKEKTAKSFLCEDMIEYEEQSLRQEMQEFCLNKNEQETKTKAQQIKQIFSEKIVQQKIKQQRLIEENKDLCKKIQILSTNQFQERCKDLQEQKEKLYEENNYKESQIQEILQINQAGQLMVEDLEKKKQIIEQQKQYYQLSKFARIKSKLMS
ncbi:unnamed protein product (macronuclear) [Paramecium tetraurelia]|uniref:Uncharacterized protein n=1 Tax=Paramecium tetraurelia TaxID=5888 RepID=A0CJK2_PARTE|nr:uncharacterized protein GSPATT00000681001 [Paramecium tetraurelia]CAK70969.1 unnamed protein product [Paramecium tetraurelia]|eukprot:XP_001438366.1 hypothetical protein (macronuclear) [Paramecium tetraurelia strain d4-2]